MIVRVQRYTPASRPYDTSSLLKIDDVFYGHVLEDCYRMVKVPKSTRIPAGEYELKLRTEGTHHEKYLAKYGADFHKGMIHLQDVKDFTYILIHIGVYVKDTDGCLLVGNGVMYRSEMASNLIESELCYKRIYPIIRDGIIKEPTRIIITD